MINRCPSLYTNINIFFWGRCFDNKNPTAMWVDDVTRYTRETK